VILGTLLGLGFWGSPTWSSEPPPVRAAVSSNFVMAFRELALVFRDLSGIEVVDSAGSTGILYAQILSGAPFDIFLAADAERPEHLESAGRIVAGSRFTYAEGVLVLWTRRPDVDLTGGEILLVQTDWRVAVANPRLAPYGRAAWEFLEAGGLHGALSDRLVFGANVIQTHQFVATANAEAGFVARSLIGDRGGSIWVVPDDMYAPISQQAVQLSADDRGRTFLEFLRSDVARDIIVQHGYRVPEQRGGP